MGELLIRGVQKTIPEHSKVGEIITKFMMAMFVFKLHSSGYYEDIFFLLICMDRS